MLRLQALALLLNSIWAHQEHSEREPWERVCCLCAPFAQWLKVPLDDVSAAVYREVVERGSAPDLPLRLVQSLQSLSEP